MVFVVEGKGQRFFKDNPALLTNSAVKGARKWRSQRPPVVSRSGSTTCEPGSKTPVGIIKGLYRDCIKICRVRSQELVGGI